MPDPHCASCRGTFVEKVCLIVYCFSVSLVHHCFRFKIENPSDDPRNYQVPGAQIPEEDDEASFNPIDFLSQLSTYPHMSPFGSDNWR